MHDTNRFTIRPMQPADYPDVRLLWARCRLPSRPNGRDAEEHIRQEIARRASSFLVAVTRDGLLIGTVFATHDGRKGWINRLAVDPQWQRRSIGHALVSAAEAELRRNGIEIIGCLIEDGNHASEKLFAAAGYIRHDEIHYYAKRDRPDV